MRPRVPWMNETDDAILEFFEELEGCTEFRITLPPTAVWYNLVEVSSLLDKAPNTVSRRMGRLDDIGLLELVDEDRAYYRFTDKGQEYLDGNLDADDLRLPEDE
jgi:hypothetical protein